MAEKLSLEQQIQEHIKDPELRHLLTHSKDFAPLLESIESTYSKLQRELRATKQTLDSQSRAYNSSQKRLTIENQEISHRAYHDSLTGLPNREYLLERLESSILQSQRNNTPFALLFIDLDKFKIVNDTYGHDYGDQLLQKVAIRLETVIRETDTIARLAGDEFCILLMNVESPTDSARVARTILREFTQAIDIKSQSFQVNMSIGISHFPEDGKTRTTLLKNADIAMYEAKQKGSNRIQFYEQRLTEQVTQRIEFEKDLAQAIKKEELNIQLQPQLKTESGELLGATATVYWQHPIRGKITAENFYDIATDNRLLLPVFEWMLEQCCLQIEYWKEKELPSVQISIPVIRQQFLHKNFIKSLINTLKRHPKAVSSLELLVSENVVAKDSNLAMRQFKQINALGLGTALSRCGSGLLPAGFFQKAKIKSIHLDENLIKEINTSESKTRLIRGLINLARNLEITTHAPGVTQASERQTLEQMKCDQVSGSYYNQPMDFNDFNIILSRFKSQELAIQVQDNLLLG